MGPLLYCRWVVVYLLPPHDLLAGVVIFVNIATNPFFKAQIKYARAPVLPQRTTDYTVPIDHLEINQQTFQLQFHFPVNEGTKTGKQSS